MRKTLWLIFLFITELTFSQSKTIIDSLRSELANQSDSSRQILMVDLAWEYSYSNLDSAEYFSKKAVALSTKLNDSTSLAIAKSMLAIVFDIQGKMNEAAQIYLDLVVIYQRDNNQEELSKTYNNLGVLFYYNDQFEKSLEYYKKSLEIDFSLGDSVGVAESMINLAAIAHKQGGYEEALSYLLRGEKIAKKNPENLYIATGLYEGLGNNYVYRNNYESGLFYFEKVLPIFQSQNDINGQLNTLNGLIGVCLYLERYDDAKTYLLEAEELSVSYDDIFRSRKRYRLASELFAELGDFEKAYNYYTKFHASYDSILQQEKQQVTNELETKYQTQQKENEIAQLQIQQQRSKNQRNVFILISALVVLGAVMLFVLFRSKSKSNAIISKSLAEKETLLKEIHHRVKNNLQVVSSLLSMQSRFIKDEIALGAVNEGQTRVESMALIHQKLYQENNLSGVNAKEYIEELADILKQSYSTDSDVDFVYDIDNLMIDVDTIIPIGLILNELICNSLKHAFPNEQEGVVSITLHEKEKHLQLEVSDNGVGSNEKSSSESFGMVLIDSLATKLKAAVKVNSENGTSTLLNITKYKLV